MQIWLALGGLLLGIISGVSATVIVWTRAVTETHIMLLSHIEESNRRYQMQYDIIQVHLEDCKRYREQQATAFESYRASQVHAFEIGLATQRDIIAKLERLIGRIEDGHH